MAAHGIVWSSDITEIAYVYWGLSAAFLCASIQSCNLHCGDLLVLVLVSCLIFDHLSPSQLQKHS